MWRGGCEINPLNYKMGPFPGFKMVPCTKSRLLEGPSTFFDTKWPLTVAHGHYRGKKASKMLSFEQGIILNPGNGHILLFSRIDFQSWALAFFPRSALSNFYPMTPL